MSSDDDLTQQIQNLKPCPFCGGKAVFSKEDAYYPTKACVVFCYDCMATSEHHQDGRQCIKEWNTRHCDKCIMDALAKEENRPSRTFVELKQDIVNLQKAIKNLTRDL